MNRQAKIFRVVTASEAVQFHLKNTLAFIADDFDVTVLGDGVTGFKAEYARINWVDTPIPRKIEPLRDLIALVRLFRYFRRHRPDIVHSIMPKAGLLAAIAGFANRIPCRMHTFTGQTWAEKKGLARAVLVFLDKVIVKLNTASFSDSPSQSAYLFANGIHAGGKPLPVLGQGSLSGVDIERFAMSGLLARREQFRREHRIAENDTVFVFVGRKCRDKGVFDLLDAFKLVRAERPEVRLLLIGPDESHGALEQKIGEMSLPDDALINLGRVEAPEQFMSAGEVFCLPSYREGFGSVVIEAAALGLPAIGSKISGLSDSIVDGVTGLLVPAAHVQALARAMQTMAHDPELRSGMAAQARERAVANYSSRRMYELLRACYREQLAGSCL